MAPSRRTVLRYCGGTLLFGVVAIACVLGANRVWGGHDAAAIAANPTANELVTIPHIEIVRASKGGLAKLTSQPGSAHCYESADLYAKVSGFLLKQYVDIGARVNQGDLLAEIDVPELMKDVESAAAGCEQAKAELLHAEAQIQSSIADQKANEARIAQSKAEIDRSLAEQEFCQKQLERFTELNDLNGVEKRVVDEKQFQLKSAMASHRAAESAVVAAEQDSAAATAKVALAKASVEVARAKLLVLQTQLDRAKLMASYTKIRSPYDGVITARNFHRGAFVRAADQGGEMPLLCVERTDQMRIVVRVPEREVPFVQPDDPAVVRFDAIPDQKFIGKVARIAGAQDPASRTMLAEIDLPNTDNLIHNHMYGRVEITLDQSSQGVTVPSTCLVGDVMNGKGKLFIVENEKLNLREVQIGKDNGVEVEVLSGVNQDENVVLRPAVGLANGTRVASSAAKTGA